MVNLFVNYYIDNNLQRQQELISCLSHNAANMQIDTFYIIVENNSIPIPKLDNEKIIKFVLSNRPSFSDYFKIANEISKDEADINIIANSDIHFDEAGIQLMKDNLKSNECYCLSRWDLQYGGDAIHFNRWDSFDTWVFKGKVKPIEDCNFGLGVAGCDDSIAERIQRAGYYVKNPSVDIKTYHLHLTGVRNYNPSDATPKPYLLISPHTIGEDKIIYNFIKNENT